MSSPRVDTPATDRAANRQANGATIAALSAALVTIAGLVGDGVMSPSDWLMAVSALLGVAAVWQNGNAAKSARDAVSVAYETSEPVKEGDRAR